MTGFRHAAALVCAVLSVGAQAADAGHMVARRIDIVDEKGVVRLSIAAPTPDPVIGGKAYARAFPVSGITLYDVAGNERGGIGIADVKGGAPVLALDHENIDAIGWKVLPDGAVEFLMNQKPPAERDPAGRVQAASRTATRLKLALAADGTPSIALADTQDRPRLRLTINGEGQGAIEFLDADGRVVDSIVPERDAAGK